MASWFQAAAEAAASASSFMTETAAKVQEKIENERKEFLEEYTRCRGDAESDPTAPGVHAARPAGPSSAVCAAALGEPEPGKFHETLEEAKRMGVALFNPFEDQDSLAAAANQRPERVIMLPWEQPGISDSVRAKMRAISQERATFLAPPVRGSSSYVFELSSNLALVMEALSIDKRLEQQRHLLVPEQVSEELFFQNYFHHLHVIAEGAAVRCSRLDPPLRSPCTSGTVPRTRSQSAPRDRGQPLHTLCVAADDSYDSESMGREAHPTAPGRVQAAPGEPHDSVSVSSPSPVLVANSDKASSESTEAPVAVTPLEEQFECISDKLTQECLATEVSSRLASGGSSCGGGARLTASMALAPPVDADDAASSWEAELRAELEAM